MKLAFLKNSFPPLCKLISPAVLIALMAIGIPADTSIALTLESAETVVENEATAPFDLGKSTIRMVDGTELEASITAIDQNGNLTGVGVPTSLKLPDVLSLVTHRSVKRNATDSVSIHVVGGGVIFGSVPGVANDQVGFQSASGIDKLELQATSAIVWSNSPLVERTIKEPSRENDIVIVTTGDGERLVEGILESIDAQHVGINYKNESRKIGIEKVKAVVTADLGLAKPKGSMAALRFVDGSSLIGVIEKLADGRLAIEVALDASVNVDTTKVADISITSDRLVYLSDTDPIEVHEDAVFAIQLPWRKDRSVGNNPLSIRKPNSDLTVTYKKGLGTQASSRLVFANSNEFDRFVATVGIDAETKGRGDCQMVVRGDGIELWSQRVRGDEGPQEIDVDISGIKQIALLVFPGEEFDLGDHANWCSARFLKTK